MQVATKPEMPSAIFVAKKDILKRFSRALMSMWKKRTDCHIRTSQKIEMNTLTLWWPKRSIVNDFMERDTGAEANIIFARTYLELLFHPVLKPCETKLKTYSSMLLPFIGQLAATISTNEKQIKTTIHVSKNHSTQSLISKHTKFDLSILPICQPPASTHQPA